MNVSTPVLSASEYDVHISRSVCEHQPPKEEARPPTPPRHLAQSQQSRHHSSYDAFLSLQLRPSCSQNTMNEGDASIQRCSGATYPSSPELARGDARTGG